ncbi:MAG TPA: AraC family transcriptional regulator [Pricia sp.]|nr:AraC family transcriptional regulator [Pricia sp.]
MINIYDFICSNSSFFNQLKFGDRGDVFIDYLCPIQEKKARAWSHKNCLMYVVQGVKGYDSVNHYHQSREHQLLFIRKGGVILHQYFQEPYRALIFMFDDAVIKEFISEYPTLLGPSISKNTDFSNQPTIMALNSNPFIKSVFIASLDYLKKPTAESVFSLKIKFKELFVNILRDKDSNTFTRYLLWLCKASDASFIKLMRENSHYNFTTKELARIACMSLSTFKREFVRILGITPGKWLRDQRMERAISLLCLTEKPISEIAFELGYNDAAAFSKAFKRATYLNPSDYRENSLN